jgi:CO/xanthine dehydrogenase FAD-binding subunit
MRAFAYERPDRLADAVALLAGAGGGTGGGGARLLAGGTDLLIRLRDGSLTPDVVVDLKHVTEIDGTIRESGGQLVIGGRTVMTDIAAHPRIRRDFTALAEAAAVVGSVQIRNRATLAGNIANASPAADTVPAMLVYEAVVVAAGPGGERRIPLDEVFIRSGVTTLRADEVITAIEMPLPDGPHGSIHLRRTRRRGHDLASVTFACAIGRDGSIRLAYGSVGPRPLLRVDEAGLLGDRARPDAERLELLDRLLAEASPSPTSMRASPDYRLAMLRVLGMRAIDGAIARRDARP